MSNTQWEEHKQGANFWYVRELEELIIYLNPDTHRGEGWIIEVYSYDDCIQGFYMEGKFTEPREQTFARANIRVRNFMASEVRKWQRWQTIWTHGNIPTIDGWEEDEDEDYSVPVD